MKSFLPILLTAVALNAAANDSIVNRIFIASDPLPNQAAESYRNPALRQFECEVDLSAVGIELYRDKQPDAAQQGAPEGEHRVAVTAESYMKRGSSTLWGHAFYHNGRQNDSRGCETADFDIIYPYVTADSIGGDLNAERYGFGGGYADCRGRFCWGASIDYTAGLYYRNVDPRPRNITGALNVAAGAGYEAFADYILSASFRFQRYSQSSSIDFKNQMGAEIIYHLTGLGNHYSRFAGVGLSANYSGYGYGVSLNMFPRSRRGIALSATASRFTFDKVLRDLNELPLVGAWHNAVDVDARWLAPGRCFDYAAGIRFSAYRRHGHENIFGDSSSNIYPMIGSIEMYADNYCSGSISALFCLHDQTRRIWIAPELGISRREEIYANPISQKICNRRYAKAEIGACTALRNQWLLELRGEAIASNFGSTKAGGAVTVARSISHRFALALSAESVYNYKLDNITNISIKLQF